VEELFGLLNILFGVVLDTTIQATKEDQETMIIEMKQHEELFCRRLTDIVSGADTFGRGTLSWIDLKRYMRNPELRYHLQCMNVIISTAFAVFRLLMQCSPDDAVEISDFVKGLLHYQGPATQVDAATLLNQMDLQQIRMRSFCNCLHSEFERLHAQIDQLYDIVAVPTPVEI